MTGFRIFMKSKVEALAISVFILYLLSHTLPSAVHVTTCIHKLSPLISASCRHAYDSLHSMRFLFRLALNSNVSEIIGTLFQ